MPACTESNRLIENGFDQMTCDTDDHVFRHVRQRQKIRVALQVFQLAQARIDWIDLSRLAIYPTHLEHGVPIAVRLIGCPDDGDGFWAKKSV